MQLKQPDLPAAHLVAAYLQRPHHQITVDLVGCGGTGSVMLTHLARLHLALLAFDHPGLMVRVFDFDSVSPANIGRQQFSPADLYQNKALSAVTRINRFYGFNWLAVPERYGPSWRSKYREPHYANILITAVDTAKARLEIAEMVRTHVTWRSSIYEKRVDANRFNRSSYNDSYHTEAYLPLYWLDLGNGKTSGQAILGNWEAMPQPKWNHGTKATAEHCLKPTDTQKLRPWVGRLPTVLDVFGDLRDYEGDAQQGPSCSLAEALGHQDLFINPAIATAGAALLWKLLRQEELHEHGVFVNLQTLAMTPRPVTRPDETFPTFKNIKRHDAQSLLTYAS